MHERAVPTQVTLEQTNSAAKYGIGIGLCFFGIISPSFYRRMSVNAFLQRLRQQPETLVFADALAIIAAHYHFTPTAFRNGEVSNAVGENSGSCQWLAFARLQGLSEADTLHGFGEHYRAVRAEPAGSNHANIRNFQRHGWAGVAFDGEPLKPRV